MLVGTRSSWGAPAPLLGLLSRTGTLQSSVAAPPLGVTCPATDSYMLVFTWETRTSCLTNACTQAFALTKPK